jgi:hypothetical protein
MEAKELTAAFTSAVLATFLQSAPAARVRRAEGLLTVEEGDRLTVILCKITPPAAVILPKAFLYRRGEEILRQAVRPVSGISSSVQAAQEILTLWRETF